MSKDRPQVFLQTARMTDRPDFDHDEGVNHLRAWREYRRMTQEALADKVKTTGPVISLLESGGRQLSAKWLRRLAPALGTTPGFLLDHDPEDVPTDVMEIWGSIPPDARGQALQILQTFRKAS